MAAYRHKSVRRYQVIAGTADHPKKFQFEDFILRIRKPEDNDIFLAAVSGLPQREIRQIEMLNEEAEQALHQPISRAIHGFADSATNLSGVKNGEGLRAIGVNEGLTGGQGAGLGQAGQIPVDLAQNQAGDAGQKAPQMPALHPTHKPTMHQLMQRK